MKHAGSLESMKDMQELLKAQPRVTLASWVLLTSQVLHISMTPQLTHEPIVL